MNGQHQSSVDVAIVGGGSMGTALARLLGESGKRVSIWVHESELADRINESRVNDLFLPGVTLPPTVTATGSLERALSGVGTVLSVTPAQVTRSVWDRGAQHLAEGAAVVSATKGVETGSAALMSEVLAEALPAAAGRLAFLSGPSFAKEIAAGWPTAVVIASADAGLASRIQQLVSTSSFRAYTTDDVVGVELGGALKNVIAIAVGVAEGMGLGLNARAALITRGLAEVTRLAVACGANPLTLAGLAGMGDLVLTCTGHLSRNLQVGIRLGREERLDAILGSMHMVAEGVATARSAMILAARHGVEMPISEAVTRLLDGEVAPGDAVRALMARPLRSERERQRVG
jgi:glycerol-3-phosphate dehydrogenase (NAD(P)+)